jgi:hypothetical protein
MAMFLTIVALTVSVALVAQESSPSASFEVATIRPSDSSLGGDQSEVQPSGRFAATNIILYDLVRVVFGLQQHEIVAGDRLPSWVRTERWDIIGKGPPVTDEEVQRPLYFRMMQNLLIGGATNARLARGATADPHGPDPNVSQARDRGQSGVGMSTESMTSTSTGPRVASSFSPNCSRSAVVSPGRP